MILHAHSIALGGILTKFPDPGRQAHAAFLDD